MIAIVNVLLLRGKLQIHPQQKEISFEELAVMLREYLSGLVSKQAGAADNESKVASLLHSHEEALRLLPKLEQGLGTVCIFVIWCPSCSTRLCCSFVRRDIDINVAFSDCTKFEYTTEIALFDLFSVRLLHGWVVDPEDKPLARCVEILISRAEIVCA